MTSIGQLCSRMGRLALSPSINMSRPSLGIKRFTTSVCQCGHLSSKTFSDKTQLLPSGISALGSIPPSRTMASLGEMLEKGVNYRKSKAKHPTFGKPFLKGLVLKVIVKKPKKPNSANRKCVRVRLSNGKEVTAYIPGEGHNLQEHHIVLVRGGNVQDLPGVKFKCVRGKYDLAHVVKKS